MSWLSSLGRKVGGALGIGDKTTTTTSALDPASQRYVDAMRAQAQAGSNVVLNGPMGQPYGGGGGGGLFGGLFSQMNAMQRGQQPGSNSWFTGPQTMSIGDQAAQFMNPYMSNVVDATRGEYDRLRAGALNNTRQEATLGGGFGGSRMAVLAGSRLGALDQGQASTISGLLAGGYQNALSQGTAYTEQQRQLRQQQMMEPIWRQQQAQGMMQNGMGPVGQTSSTTQPGGGLFGAAVGLGQTAMGMGWNPFGGGQQPSQFAMPQPWQAPQWGAGYQNPYMQR